MAKTIITDHVYFYMILTTQIESTYQANHMYNFTCLFKYHIHLYYAHEQIYIKKKNPKRVNIIFGPEFVN